ncbi:MAG: hypothetical protein ABI682_12740 [Acidobacteriota bacterium]
MRKLTLRSIALIFVLAAPAALAATGTGEVVVNTNTSVAMTLGANVTLALVGWAPVINTMSARFGSINAYINCSTCTFADLNGGTGQSAITHVGQFTVESGPPIIAHLAWQQNGPMNINNTGTSKTVMFGCVGGAVAGACLFNVRTIPSGDPSF